MAASQSGVRLDDVHDFSEKPTSSSSSDSGDGDTKNAINISTGTPRKDEISISTVISHKDESTPDFPPKEKHTKLKVVGLIVTCTAAMILNVCIIFPVSGMLHMLTRTFPTDRELNCDLDCLAHNWERPWNRRK